MKKRSIYSNMTASDLARITRERGLEKPNVITLSEWADFLEDEDKKRQNPDAGTDTAFGFEETAPSHEDFEAMTVKQLKAALAERDGDLTGLNTRAELIDALEASWGITEDEQQNAESGG